MIFSKTYNKDYRDNYERIFKMELKTKRNGGQATLKEVAEAWKANPSAATKAITTEESSKWAASFTKKAKNV